MINHDLKTVFELAAHHQLEVNAGIAKPDAVGITLMSYDVLPRNTPLLLISDESSVAEVVDRAVALKADSPYSATSGNYRGFSWVIEHSDHAEGAIDRFVIGAVTQNFYNDTFIWTPVESSKAFDIHAELEDDPLAEEITEVVTDPCLDPARFIRTCQKIPSEDLNQAQLYLSLVNSLVGANEIFASVNSPGSVENFGDRYIEWGDDSGVTRYDVVKGDTFGISDIGGDKRLAVIRRLSEVKFYEKIMTVSLEMGFERALTVDC